jgi:sulfur-carrier protein adenylyltransferase/sulfurtransferase
VRRASAGSASQPSADSVIARIELPQPLRAFAAGAADVAVHAHTVRAALDALVRRYPLMRRHLFDDAGRLRGYVNIYHNDDPAPTLDARLAAGDTIMIVPSIAGGGSDAFAAFDSDERARYSRHFALPDVGVDGQLRLRRARVLIVGAGGLGSPVSLYLAAAGVGTIGLVEFDDVDLSNLQRQILYTSADIGTPKIVAAADRLRATNPNTIVATHDVRLSSENALAILREYDIVVDGTDNFPTRYLVNDACVLLGKPYVYGSILRFEGQVAVFDARNAPCYRCLFREPPPPGLVPSCAEGGVLGVLPGIIGSMQALEAIKLILQRGVSLAGRLALFDALAFRWRELRLRKRDDCAVCGANPTVTGLIDYDEFCGVKGPDMSDHDDGLAEITPTELRERLDRGDVITLIDVREPFEWEIANLGEHGARLIPLGELPDRIDEIDKAADIVVYCRSGARSASVARHLLAAGYRRVANLNGGINAWAEALDPDMPTY